MEELVECVLGGNAAVFKQAVIDLLILPDHLAVLYKTNFTPNN